MNKFAKKLLTLIATLAFVTPGIPAMAADNPVNSTAPTVTGNMAFQRTITYTSGTWTAAGSVTTAGLWYACTNPIPTAVATVPADCTALTNAGGWQLFGGQSINYILGTNNSTIFFGSALPSSLLGKYMTIKETATSSTDSSTSIRVAANTEPLVATGSHPTVTTTAATNITDTTATVGGTFIANNSACLIGYYRANSSATIVGNLTNGFYGDPLSGASAWFASQAPFSSYGTVTVSNSLTFTSMTAGTQYWYQAMCDSYSDYGNTQGRFNMGPVSTFTTKNIAYFQTTGSTSGAAPTDATLYAPGIDSITLPGQGTLVKTGYSFVGWSRSGTTYKEGDTMLAPLGAWYFSPVWVAGNSLTYLANGGTGTLPVESASPYTGAGSAVAKDGSTLSRSGYTFDGWNTKADGTGTSYVAGATVPVTSQVKLYAQWLVVPPQVQQSPAQAPLSPQIGGFTSSQVQPGQASTLTLSGSNFTSSTSVSVIPPVGNAFHVNSVPVTETQLEIQIPPLDPGVYDLEISNANGKVRWGNAFRVLAVRHHSTPQANYTSWTISSFVPGSASLTAAQKKVLKSSVLSKPGMTATCTGYTQGPKILASDKALALSRAKAVCQNLKTLLGGGFKYQVFGVTETELGATVRRVVVDFK